QNHYYFFLMLPLRGEGIPNGYPARKPKRPGSGSLRSLTRPTSAVDSPVHLRLHLRRIEGGVHLCRLSPQLLVAEVGAVAVHLGDVLRARHLVHEEVLVGDAVVDWIVAADLARAHRGGSFVLGQIDETVLDTVDVAVRLADERLPERMTEGAAGATGR